MLERSPRIHAAGADDQDELVAMRELTAATPPPILRWGAATIAPTHAALFATTPLAGYTATLDDRLGAPAKLPDGSDDPARDQPGGAAHHALAAIFDAPNFLRDREGGCAVPEHATVARDAPGEAADRSDEAHREGVDHPRAAAGKGAPAGFPVVLLQHGLGGDRSFLLALADTFARQGWASVAIEAIREPYLGLQAVAVSFFSRAFAGGAPQVKNIPPPRRDFDDGTDDASDPDPLDPAKK